jgi:hypothetical protein
MRSSELPRQLVVVKRPDPAHPREIYSVGMERVAYALGEELGVPVPDTRLEVVDGHPSSVQKRIVNARSHLQLPTAPAMHGKITNRELWPVCALFDVWLGNTDRRNVNLIFEPVPPEARPGVAKGSLSWLVDHGYCGLWPANKVDAARPYDDVPDDPATIGPDLTPQAEQIIVAVMPDDYKQALRDTQGADRNLLLDRVRGVGDDLIEEVVYEVPDVYFTPEEAATTIAFLKARRDALDKVINPYW